MRDEAASFRVMVTRLVGPDGVPLDDLPGFVD